jgi:hypothetical protein
LFDPSTGIWSPTGMMNIPRDFHSATLLADGRHLVTGGISTGEGGKRGREDGGDLRPRHSVWSSVITWPSQVGSYATLLLDGTVLVAGGTGPAFDGNYTVRGRGLQPSV